MPVGIDREETMNDIKIRALYRDLMEPAPDLETANRQRKLAAEAALAKEADHG